MFRAFESEGWSSSAAIWASQTRVALSLQTTKSISPARSNPTRRVFTQSGAPFGARFS